MDVNKLVFYVSILLFIFKELDIFRLDICGSGILFDGYGSGIVKEFLGF